MTDNWPPNQVSISPGKRVLFLTKDLSLIKRQLYDGLNLRMSDLSPDELLDDINTDAITFDQADCCLYIIAPAGLQVPCSADLPFVLRALIDTLQDNGWLGR